MFCLNRSADGGRAAQHDQFVSARFDTEVLNNSSHVAFLHANLAEPILGLSPKMYDMLRSRVALIAHNAWPANFDLPLLSFQPQLAGPANLLTLAVTALPQPVRTVFISSIGDVASLGPAEVFSLQNPRPTS